MDKTIYADNLVEITEYSILFRNYYIFRGAKKVRFADIESLEIFKPTVMNGKWRIHGTGNFRTWFPRDLKRPFRDTIFRITLHNRWWRIGFTVENSAGVKKIFEEKGLLTTAND